MGTGFELRYISKIKQYKDITKEWPLALQKEKGIVSTE
jgi:hypothetical protein